MCTDLEINRFRIDEVCNNCMFDLTSRDAKTVRRTSWGPDTSDRHFDKEHFETNQKYGSNSGFRVFGDLDVWPMFHFFCHTHCA